MNKLLKKVGKYTYGHNRNLTIHYWSTPTNTIKIGSFCSIAKNCSIILNGEHNTDWITTFPFRSFKKKWNECRKIKGHPKSKGNVIISNDVWIGMNVTILSGVKINDGAVIATGSIVTKDVEPYSIVGGVPAKHLKYRFDKDQIEKLLKIKWWNWSDEKIRENVLLLSSNNINNFIEKHYVK